MEQYNETLSSTYSYSQNTTFGGSNQARHSGGVGYIYTPSDIGRDEYIIDCLTNNWLSIYIEGEGVTHRVHTPHQVLNFISFGMNEKELGSPVVWILHELKKQIVVVATYQDYSEIGNLEENTFSFIRKFGNSFVEIRGNPAKNYLNLVLVGNGESNLNIICRNSQKNSTITIESDGQVAIKSKEVVLRSLVENQFIARGRDSHTTIGQTPTEITLQGPAIIINSGDQAALLGNIFQDFIDDFIVELSKVTITTSIGQMPILNKQQVLDFQKRVHDLVSEKFFYD